MSNVLKLWLGRHAEAVDADVAGTDFDRALSAYGRQQIGQLVRWLLTREEPPELVLHSPLVRARQTAEVIAEEIGNGAVLMEESLLSPGFSTQPLLQRLKDCGVGRVVCIGHQPDIGHCLSEITGTRALISPGTIAGIEFFGPVATGSGALRWLADPYWFSS